MQADGELLDRWAAGNQEAGRTFYLRYADRVARFFASKTRDDVADLVQRTFLKCLSARRRGEEIGNPAALLFAIARNELFDDYRARAHRPEAFDPAVTSVEDLATGLTQRLARNEQGGLLAQALRSLPLDGQVALELYYWEELSMEDIARVLGVTRSAAINRVHRARQLVADRLRALDADPALVQAAAGGLDTWARTVRPR